MEQNSFRCARTVQPGVADWEDAFDNPHHLVQGYKDVYICDASDVNNSHED